MRQYSPKEKGCQKRKHTKNAEVKALGRGDSLYWQKSTITCVGWKDSEMVYKLATTPEDASVNSEVEGSIRVNNKRQKKAVKKQITSIILELMIYMPFAHFFVMDEN